MREAFPVTGKSPASCSKVSLLPESLLQSAGMFPESQIASCKIQQFFGNNYSIRIPM
ncbi:hypothetical protein [Chryseobacterium sp. GP-SGM7]|uniref:hypothetical protein n=1 Tax=Chryseobacterium sp. GP-SGM7 TaxID=3411323 RepID=UPI003B93C71D